MLKINCQKSKNSKKNKKSNKKEGCAGESSEKIEIKQKKTQKK